MNTRQARQQRIREILTRNEVHTQEQLLGLLQAERVSITQATLSRDLRDLGAVRGPSGYVIKGGRSGTPDARGLERSLRGTVLEANRGGTLVVLRTQPGHASAVVRQIDELQLAQVLGTIAGHDTVFIATASAGAARIVHGLIARASRLPKP